MKFIKSKSLKTISILFLSFVFFSNAYAFQSKLNPRQLAQANFFVEQFAEKYNLDEAKKVELLQVREEYLLESMGVHSLRETDIDQSKKKQREINEKLVRKVSEITGGTPSEFWKFFKSFEPEMRNIEA